MSYISKLKTINLKDFKTTEDILNKNFNELDGDKCQNWALVFSKQSESEKQTDLCEDMLRYSLDVFSSTLRNMDSINNIAKTGVIDDKLKFFLLKHFQITTWLINSYSVTSPKMDEFACFDRMELKIKLQSLVEML